MTQAEYIAEQQAASAQVQGALAQQQNEAQPSPPPSNA
jgi:hypothetical protein